MAVVAAAANINNINGGVGDGAKGGTTAAAGEHGHHTQDGVAMDGALALQDHESMSSISQQASNEPPSPFANPADISLITPSHALQHSYDHSLPLHHDQHHRSHHHQQSPTHHHQQNSHHNPMLQDPPTGHHPHESVYQPIDPQIINQTSPHDLNSFDPYHSPADFQALLNATEDVVPDNVDRDLEMLIEHPEDDDMVDGMGVGMDDRGLQHKGRTLYDVGFDTAPGGGP